MGDRYGVAILGAGWVAGEQAFQRLFGEQLLLVYPELDADRQQALAVLPRTRDELAQAWPQLAGAQRRAIAQEWAAGVEPMLADMPCELYVALERAELVPSGPYEQVNAAQLFACWDANPTWLRRGLRQPVVVRALAPGRGRRWTSPERLGIMRRQHQTQVIPAGQRCRLGMAGPGEPGDARADQE